MLALGQLPEPVAEQEHEHGARLVVGEERFDELRGRVERGRPRGAGSLTNTGACARAMASSMKPRARSGARDRALTLVGAAAEREVVTPDPSGGLWRSSDTPQDRQRDQALSGRW
ncbi:hypothetical protein GCM10020219_021420 [Nonomuraea dietziae]